MGKGWDVVRIHLLTLHMISIADGPASCKLAPYFSQTTLSEHGKIYLCMCNTWAGEERRGLQVNSTKAFSNDQTIKQIVLVFQRRLFVYLFFFLWMDRAVYYYHRDTTMPQKPQATRNVLTLSSDRASWVWDEWWNNRAACQHSDAHYVPRSLRPPSGTY